MWVLDLWYNHILTHSPDFSQCLKAAVTARIITATKKSIIPTASVPYLKSKNVSKSPQHISKYDQLTRLCYMTDNTYYYLAFPLAFTVAVIGRVGWE